MRLGCVKKGMAFWDNGPKPLLEQIKNGSFFATMPNMDGLTFLKAIRERNAEIPFIMITTEAERQRVVTAIQAGVTDYLTKPFTPESLREKLEKWVQVTAA